MSAGATVQIAAQRYLDERRRLGFDLRIAGKQLMRFARYADARGHCGPLTLDIQLEWAREHVRRTSSVTWARRLEIIRPFAAYYRQFEPQTVVPDSTTFGRGHRRLTPHIYTEQEISDLLDATRSLGPEGGLRAATYQTLFGLIASTGLRLSEALRLQEADVDLRSAALVVQQTKFNKSRRLPIHTSVVHALDGYRHIRDQVLAPNADRPFFVSAAGKPLPSRTVHSVFAQLRGRLGWVARGGHPQPRIHDLRHTFAVRRLQLWHESGVSMDQGIFMLCTYLGHAKVSDTYWYLTGAPELMALVGTKFERFAFGMEVEHG